MRTIYLVPLLLLMGCGGKDRTPCVYEMPADFRGWVIIEYSRSDGSPIPVESGKRVFRIPASGYLCTSSPMEGGSAKDEWYLVGESRKEIHHTMRGGGGLVWAGHTGFVEKSGQPAREYEEFFVGTEEDLDSAGFHPELPPLPSNK